MSVMIGTVPLLLLCCVDVVSEIGSFVISERTKAEGANANDTSDGGGAYGNDCFAVELMCLVKFDPRNSGKNKDE